VNAIVRHPPISEADHIVGLMAATLRRAYEAREVATVDDLTRAGFDAEEIAAYGEIARGRLARQMFRVELGDAAAASDPVCLAGVPDTIPAASPLPDPTSAAADVALIDWPNSEKSELGRGEGQSLPRTRSGGEGAQPPGPLPFALPLAVVDGEGTLSLVAADGEELIRSKRRSDTIRVKLDALALCCNAWRRV
jgi:hypothetical protein